MTVEKEMILRTPRCSPDLLKYLEDKKRFYTENEGHFIFHRFVELSFPNLNHF